MQMPENRDDVNVLDDQPELLFGPEVDGKSANGAILPFYVSLHLHDKVLHNAMFDSGASHNLIPKAVMEKLNLDVTRAYKDLFSFDSSQVFRLNQRLMCLFSPISQQNNPNGRSGS